MIATALGRGDTWLPPDDVAALLDYYGLPTAEQRVASTPDEAGAAAEEMGGPVALKANGPGLLHKTELGAVALNLDGRSEVTRAARAMTERLAGAGQSVASFLVQRMIPDGVEMIAGLVQDPSFGPVLACGAGGVTAELIKDVSVRLTPLSERDASEMVSELRTYPLLTGYRGAPPCDVAALQELLRRLGTLADDLPQVIEMDCNPVKVAAHGVVVLDARVRVAPVEAPRPLGARR